ncbi:hypothetical protein [Lacrimispora amygdalina]|uniref:hypothetical protein n=1 Tax=Lacrimispora amygdalina TaxID=253257 RepID=UPI000BE31022|nr:hypothetical protein [Lacrimispora amygdalina]
MKTKYPFQIDSIVHKSKTIIRTFGMEARLFSPQEENEEREPAAPLEMHEGYSVFKGTLITKEGTDRKFVTFNIPAKDVSYIYKKTSMVMAEALKNKLKSVNKVTKSEDIPSSAAYTVKMTSGTLKGKTPAEILSESESNKEKLENQKKWLIDNVEKYPKNQIQIDAIDEALKLSAEGKLIVSSSSSVTNEGELPIIEIYSCPPKNVKPLDGDGRYTIYDILVTYDGSKGMPFTVSINNCFAPVDRSKGTNEIVMSKAVSKKKISMALSEEEWFTMVDTMLSHKKMFENLTYPEQLKLAKKINDENRIGATT